MLFSVKYYNAFISSSHLVLSDIRIPIQWCPTTVQRSCKGFILSCRRFITPWQVLFGFIFFGQASYIVSLPGTNYAIVKESSLDTFCQGLLQRSVIYQTTADVDSNSTAIDVDTVQPDFHLHNKPFCLIDDK